MIPEFPYASRFRHLGSALRSAGFTDRGLQERLAIDAQDLVRPLDLPTATLRLGEDVDALATFVRLFYLNLETPLALLDLDDPLVAELLDAEALVHDGRTAHATIRLSPYRDLILASDPLSVAAADLVQGPTVPADLLASVTVRDHADRVLDLGAGGGVQALLAARHAGQVTAIDANPRSAWFVQANAALNDVQNITTVTGDWFGPVDGERFDLIVCNPPYVISPDSTYLYRDNGWDGDDLCWSLLEEAVARLNDGGYCHMVCNWIERADDRWPAAVRRRLEDLPCDACVIRYGGSDPLRYASVWNRTLKEDRDAHEHVLRRWLAYYDRLQVREIGQGIVVLRRTHGRRPRMLLREGRRMPEFGESASEHTKAIFEAMDVAMMSDSDVLESRLMAGPGLRIEQQYATYDGAQFAVPAATVSLEPGLGVSTLIDPDHVPVVLSLRADRALVDVVADLDLASSHDGATIANLLRTFRELISLGLVLVSEADLKGS